FFHPTRVLCVGFEEEFFKKLQGDLHPQDAVVLESCHCKMAALFLLNRTYRKHGLPQETVCSSEKDYLSRCYQRISSLERFYCFSIVVVNSKPSIEEALLWVGHIQDWRIKKILVAEPSESAVAFEALQMRFVDALFFSRVLKLETRVLEGIYRLQWRYFLEYSGVFIPVESDQGISPPSSALYDSFDELLDMNSGIVEFYQLDPYGTYFFLTEFGTPIVLFFDGAPWPSILKKEEATLQRIRRYSFQMRERRGSLLGNLVEGASFIIYPYEKVFSFFDAKQHNTGF
ncbi:MAG: hypothetical protein LBD15_01835, partial [Holosporales bacterium]|nr:hypothetical protein [Holosporales bacterium]